MDLAGYRGSFDKLWGYTNVVRLGTEHLSEDVISCWFRVLPVVETRPGSHRFCRRCSRAVVRAVAPELAPKRINVVSPSVIDTPMFGNDAEARAKMLVGATAKNLIPRAGTPESRRRHYVCHCRVYPWNHHRR